MSLDNVEVAGKARSDEIWLGWVGRFSRDKRLEDFLRAVEILNVEFGIKARGLIIGNRSDSEIKRFAFPRQFFKHVGGVDCPQDYLRECDLNIITSQREGYGMTPLEAALVGTPTIGYETKGTSKSIGEVGGVLVKSKEIDDLVAAILCWTRLSYEDKKIDRYTVKKLSISLLAGSSLAKQTLVLYGKDSLGEILATHN
jgi:glycosyltransferase involved in cell wall biosynthesis